MNTLQYATSFRLLKVRQAFVDGASVDEVYQSTKIDPWFLNQIKLLVGLNKKISLLELKENGFSDSQIAKMKKRLKIKLEILEKNKKYFRPIK